MSICSLDSLVGTEIADLFRDRSETVESYLRCSEIFRDGRNIFGRNTRDESDVLRNSRINVTLLRYLELDST